MVEDLVTRIGVERVQADLDPGNVASQRVLEAVGLVCEGVTRKSFLWRGEWSDNMSYAATREEWLAWRERPLRPPAEVALAPVTSETVRDYLALETHRSQERFVPPMSRSFAQALYPPTKHGHRLVPRPYGITADGVPVGFCMFAEATPASPPYLWRFLVDRRHQRRGIGHRALTELVDLLTREGAHSLVLGWNEGPGSPRRFYEGFGFRATGEVFQDETLAQLDW
jgi:RimJ/RimL family protein N-acetyltransferase